MLAVVILFFTYIQVAHAHRHMHMDEHGTCESSCGKRTYYMHGEGHGAVVVEAFTSHVEDETTKTPLSGLSSTMNV